MNTSNKWNRCQLENQWTNFWAVKTLVDWNVKIGEAKGQDVIIFVDGMESRLVCVGRKRT